MDAPRPALGRRGRSVRERRPAVPRRAHAAVFAVLRLVGGALAVMSSPRARVYDVMVVGFTCVFLYLFICFA